MKQAHFFLQGKGGVGKTLHASIFAQYLNQNAANIQCFDTDPVNRTFTHYKALSVEPIELMGKNKQIEQRAFDTLIEKIVTEDKISIIDNGASSFVPLAQYISNFDVLNVLQENGVTPYIHTIITAGQGMLDTIQGFKSLSDIALNNSMIIWLNEYFGDINLALGKDFTTLKVYQEAEKVVRGIVHVSSLDFETSGKDFSDMATKHQTFEEALRDEDKPLMVKQRIKQISRAYFDELQCMNLFENK